MKDHLTVRYLPSLGGRRSDWHMRQLNATGPTDIYKIEQYVLSLKSKLTNRGRPYKLSAIKQGCVEIRASYLRALGPNFYNPYVHDLVTRIFKRITPKSVPHNPRKLISLEEFDLLTTRGTLKNRVYCELIGSTALRLAETASIRNAAIQPDTREPGYHLVYVNGKGTKERYVPIPTPLLNKIWSAWGSRNAEFLFQSKCGRVMNTSLLAARVHRHSLNTIGRHTSPHDYRAFFATNAYLEEPTKVPEIMAIMGISTSDVFFKHYVRRLDGWMRQSNFRFLNRTA